MHSGGNIRNKSSGRSQEIHKTIQVARTWKNQAHPARVPAEEQAEVEESMSDIDGNILAFVYFVAVMQS